MRGRSGHHNTCIAIIVLLPTHPGLLGSPVVSQVRCLNHVPVDDVISGLTPEQIEVLLGGGVDLEAVLVAGF